MGDLRTYGRSLAQIPGVVLWGCLGGIFMAAGYLLLQLLWDPILGYNVTLYPVFQVQILGSFAIILLVTGMIAADLFCTKREDRLDPILIGLLSGICTALILTVILVVCDIVSHPPILRFTDDPFRIRMFSDRLLIWVVPLVQNLIFSGIVQAVGAWYQGSRRDDGGLRGTSSRRSALTGMVFRHRFALFALLAVLMLPAGLVYLGMNTGILAEQSPSWAITDSVNVTRTGPDSIRIVMQPDPKIHAMHAGSRSTVKIFLNEKDVSNQSAIAGSGLDDSIDPLTGLMYQSGASAILRGSDVSGNDTVPAHLRVMVTWPDTGTGEVIGDRDI